MYQREHRAANIGWLVLLTAADEHLLLSTCQPSGW
jgi:hypothetical protein